MAMFNKELEGKVETRSGNEKGDGPLSIIASGMTVTGDIVSSGVVKVEGRVEGSIRSGRQVLIGRQGEVKGDIETREAIIGGEVSGSITASERTEIQGTAKIDGDIHTKTVVVLEGGVINGSVRMEENVSTKQIGGVGGGGGAGGGGGGAEPRPQAVAVVR